MRQCEESALRANIVCSLAYGLETAYLLLMQSHLDGTEKDYASAQLAGQKAIDVIEEQEALHGVAAVAKKALVRAQCHYLLGVCLSKRHALRQAITHFERAW